MEKAVVNFRIDKTTKKEMEEICEDIGISIGTAFNIFEQMEKTGGTIHEVDYD